APRNGRAACLGEGVCKGQCDGETMDACTFPGADVTCEEESCTAGFATSSAQCNGAGLCSRPAMVACAPYACDGNVCATSCDRAADCAKGMYCVDGVCQAEPPADVILPRPGVV